MEYVERIFAIDLSFGELINRKQTDNQQTTRHTRHTQAHTRLFCMTNQQDTMHTQGFYE